MMGLWVIDEVNMSEYERKAMRRHLIKRWLVLIGELLLMAGALVAMIWIAGEVRP